MANAFRLIQVLGQGSYATCYFAEQLGTERHAVVKITHPHLIQGKNGDYVRERFAEELRASTRVHHNNLATVYTSGYTDEGLPFIAMEHVPGASLKEFLREAAPLARGVIETLLGELLDALVAVHDADIIHRDVTPNNIIVRPDRRPVLIDFGVARLDSGTGNSLHPVGTPRYIAPEQIRGDTVDRSDMFSFGAILWWAITGKEYLSEVQGGDLLAAQLSLEEPPDPRQHRPSLTRRAAHLVSRLLHPDPAMRPSARELSRDWHTIMGTWANSSQMSLLPVSQRPGTHRGFSALPDEEPLGRFGTLPTDLPNIEDSGFNTRPPSGGFQPTPTRPRFDASKLRAPAPTASTRVLLIGTPRCFAKLGLTGPISLSSGEVERCDFMEALNRLRNKHYEGVFLTCLRNWNETFDKVVLLREQGLECPIYMLSDKEFHGSLSPMDLDGFFWLPHDRSALDEELHFLTGVGRRSLQSLQSSELPGLDWGRVQAHLVNTTLKSQIEFFIGHFPEWISAIDEAVDDGDMFLIRMLARYIFDAAQEIGAVEMEAHAKTLLNAIEQGKEFEVPSLAQDLEQSYYQVFRSLLTLRKTLGLNPNDADR